MTTRAVSHWALSATAIRSRPFSDRHRAEKPPNPEAGDVRSRPDRNRTAPKRLRSGSTAERRLIGSAATGTGVAFRKASGRRASAAAPAALAAARAPPPIRTRRRVSLKG